MRRVPQAQPWSRLDRAGSMPGGHRETRGLEELAAELASQAKLGPTRGSKAPARN